MKRRTFIVSSAAAAVAVPLIYYFKKNKWQQYTPVSVPAFLSTICDEGAIKVIGKSYLKQRPLENSKQKLKNAVLADGRGGMFSVSDEDALAAFIHSKILAEFNAGNTLLADGWVLSETEARQCALFSLTY